MVKIPSKFNIYIFFFLDIRLKSQYGVLCFRDLPLKVFLSFMNKPKKNKLFLILILKLFSFLVQY